MKKARVISYIILCLIILTESINCSNFLKFNGHLSLQKIKRNPLVEISITESLLQSAEQKSQIRNFEFFILKSVSRHKNKTYLKLLKNYEKLVNILIHKIIIGDERLLIKSKIKQKYMKKKKLWEFGIMFMMQGQQTQINECYYDISRLGVTKLNFKPKTTALNERIIASNAFYKLKRKIWNEISLIPRMSILKVLNVDISGFRIPHSINLQRKQLEQNSDQMKDSNDQKSYPSDYFFLKAEVPKQSKSVTLKATFEVGYESDNDSDQSEKQSEDSQFQSGSSQSSFDL